MMFASQFAPIRGIWAGFFASAGSAHRGAIHESTVPIDLVGCLEFCEQNFKKALPDPRLLPLSKMTQAGVPGRKIIGGRKPTPRDARPQNEKDAGDNPPQVSWLSSGELNMAVLPWLADQRLKAFPKVIG